MSATRSFLRMPGSIRSTMRACIFSTMRAAMRMYSISRGDFNARCQLTSAVAPRHCACGSLRCKEGGVGGGGEVVFAHRGTVVGRRPAARLDHFAREIVHRMAFGRLHVVVRV